MVAHGVLVYQLADAAFVIVEDESTDSKSLFKEGKESSSEKISFCYDTDRNAFDEKLQKNALSKSFAPSKGFYDTPYNPPKAV